MIRDAAMSSIARVIFLVVETVVRRCLSSRRLAGMSVPSAHVDHHWSAPPLADDLLLLDLALVHRLVLLPTGTGEHLALSSLEATLELRDLLAQGLRRV